MLLGYLIMRALPTPVRMFSRHPAGVSRAYARLLNTAITPFDAVNYVGSSLGETFLGRDRMAAMFDRVITVLHRRLDTETDADLTRFFGGVLAECCPDSLTRSQPRCKEPTNHPAGGGRRPSFMRCTIWRDAAENVANSLSVVTE